MSEPNAEGEKRGPLFRIARNAISILVGDAFGEILTGYAILLAASTLGPGGFGRLSDAQNFMDVFDILASFGLGTIIVKVAAERGGVDGALRGTSLAMRYVTAPIAVVVALTAAYVTGRGNMLPLLLVMAVNTLTVPLTATATLPFDFHQTQHRRIALPLLASLVRFGTAILAVRMMATPVGFQLSGVSAGLAMMLMSVWLARRYYSSPLAFDAALVKRLLRLAWPAAFLEFIVMMYLRGSYLVLHSQGDVALGEYAAGDRLVKPIMAVGSIFLASALPTIAVLVQEGAFATLMKAYRRTIARMLMVMLPALTATWFAAPLILQRFAPRWAGAVWPFRILSISVLFVFLNSLSSVFIIALGQLRLVTVVALVNLVVFFGLAFQLVPIYGAAGAATATTTMEGINTIMQLTIVGVLLRRAMRAKPATPGVHQ
jgi:O-antigen/teichoic acid export membrane protein